jgi:D-glycero-alpha-D-manno-heptose-7-phosphate kinase
MLFFAKPETHAQIKAALPGLLQVPFQFEGLGSQIVFYQQEAPILRDVPWADDKQTTIMHNAAPIGKVA